MNISQGDAFENAEREDPLPNFGFTDMLYDDFRCALGRGGTTA